MSEHIRNLTKELLSDYKSTLEKISFDYLRSDGVWQCQDRVVFSRKDATVVLMYNKETKHIILTRQFRLPTYLNGNGTGMLIEAPAGTIDDNESPETCIRREIEEETGYRVLEVKQILQAYLSPGSVTEKLYFFIAEYTEAMRQGKGGGTDETEDIEVIGIPFTKAVTMVADGTLQDAKTIILIQYAQINQLLG